MGLELLFAESDNVFVSNIGEFGTCDEFVGTPAAVATELIRKSRQFFCINPIKHTRRVKDEVARFQSFMFESDSTPLEQQYALLPEIMKLGIVRTATYSGGKSIHFIVNCADHLNLGDTKSLEAETAYKDIWKGLAFKFIETGLVLDTAGKNQVTLSRLPGMFRGNTEQKLLSTGNMVTAEYLHSIAVRSVKRNYVQSSTAVADITQLEQRLKSPEHQWLAFDIKYPAWVSPNEGNYREILRVALWAIDEVGATPDTLFTYFEKHLVPHLHARNYHKDWELPVYHAFRKKGLL